MTKNVLLAVTGMSPQVVTETLYAIHDQNLEWPDEIQVITTSVGKPKILDGLITAGNLAALCKDYRRPLPAFEEAQVLVVPGANGEPVSDARTLEDHEAMADFITDKVRLLTHEDQNNRLHASLAGGRKTMTFYLGYAMSLFGRTQDRLSHVLVSADFEHNQNFYYPTPYSRTITLSEPGWTKPGTEPRMADCQDARVMLADIPFIRHRKYLPDAFHHLHHGVSFRELINLMNLDSDPESIRVILDDGSCSILVQDRAGETYCTTALGLAEYAFYRLIVRDNQSGEMAVQRCEDGIPDTDLAYEYLIHLFDLANRPYDPAKPLTDLLDILGDAASDRSSDHRLGMDIRSIKSMEQGINDGFIARRVNRICNALRDNLPENMTLLLEPRLLWNVEEARKITEQELADRRATKIGKRNAAYTFRLESRQFTIRTTGNG